MPVEFFGEKFALALPFFLPLPLLSCRFPATKCAHSEK
jgi:hypothetical protein